MRALSAALLATAASLGDWVLVGTRPEPLLWLILYLLSWFIIANHPFFSRR